MSDHIDDIEDEMATHERIQAFWGSRTEFDTTIPEPTDSHTMPNESDDSPIDDGATVHIHAPDPLRVTRAGTTYHAWDIDDEGDPVGDPWALTEGAVRGLLGRHDWTRVEGEAQASVRGGGDA